MFFITLFKKYFNKISIFITKFFISKPRHISDLLIFLILLYSKQFRNRHFINKGQILLHLIGYASYSNIF